MESRRERRCNPWANELDDLIRGASGGFLFGIPLIYTMEVWWIGASVKPPRMVLALLLTFVIVFMLNRTAGFRKTEDASVINALMDSVEAIALGMVCTSLVLVLLREITFNTPLHETVGKILYEGIPFTLGVALANQVLSGDRQGNDEKGDHPSRTKDKNGKLNATLSDVGATIIGTIIIAFNIAPTDEVPMLASAVSGLRLLTVMAASLLISYAIVFAAGFANQQKRHQQQGIFQHPMSETVISYLISLISAAVMLVFFDKLSWDDPWQLWLSHTLILGLPATIGGAAGRLAV